MLLITTDTYERFKKGDTAATEKIYHHYKAPVVRFIVSMVKDAEESEGIFHEVFMKVIRKRKELDCQKGIQSYIFTIAKNEVIDYFNKLNNSRKKAEEYYKNRIETEVDVKQEEEVLLDRLEEAVANLTEQRKKVVEMSYYEDLSYQEIAERLMISKNTVKNHLIKARVSLRSYLS